MQVFHNSSFRRHSAWLLLALLYLIACSSPQNAECQSDSQCRIGAVCNKRTGKCQPANQNTCGDGTCAQGSEDCQSCPKDCSCPSGQTCSASGACNGSSIVFCQNNSDCPSGQVCNGSKCVQERPLGCSPQKPCPSGQTCNNGRCEPASSGCSAQKPCPRGQECRNGNCVPGNNQETQCQSDSDCKSTEVCDPDFNVCATQCNSDSDCPNSPRQICYDNNGTKYCVDGCLNDNDCEDNERCDTQFKECAQKCDNNNPCPQGETCNSQKGLCEPDTGTTKCSSDNDCKANELCDTEFGECVKRCNSDSDCSSNPREICYEESDTKKFCIPGCLSNSDCEADELCDVEFKSCAQKCDSNNKNCPSGESCDLRKGFCVPD